MSFSTNQVASLTQLSKRKLQWWSERRYLRPVVVGWARQWSGDEMLIAAIASALLNKGMTTQRIARHVIPYLRRSAKHLQNASAFLLVEANRCSLHFEQEPLFWRIAAATHPVHVVSLGKLHAQIARHGASA